MINYSIWSLTKFKTLEEFLDVLNSNKIENRVSGKAYGCLKLKNEISNIKDLPNISIRNVELMNEKVRYVAFNANSQVCRKNPETDEYEVKDNTENVIAFEKNNMVKMIILASQNNAERVIKRIFSNGLVWGIIEEDNYITEDMLYWLFYRLRELPEKLIISSPELYLNGIISYLGRTNDKINAVRGIGIRVSALLGTLGMLLGEESLRALRPIIQYGQHEINVELFIGNTGKLYENTYHGELNIDIENEISKITLVLLVCKFILPSILKGYKDCCDKKEWSIYIKQTFLRAVGNEMADKISKEMKRIDLEINKYKEESEQLEDDSSDISEIEELLDYEDIEEMELSLIHI